MKTARAYYKGALLTVTLATFAAGCDSDNGEDDPIETADSDANPETEGDADEDESDGEPGADDGDPAQPDEPTIEACASASERLDCWSPKDLPEDPIGVVCEDLPSPCEPLDVDLDRIENDAPFDASVMTCMLESFRDRVPGVYVINATGSDQEEARTIRILADGVADELADTWNTDSCHDFYKAATLQDADLFETCLTDADPYDQYYDCLTNWAADECVPADAIQCPQ